MTEPHVFSSALNAAGIEYAGFSCNGVNLFGDSASIDALTRWHHEAGTVPALKEEIKRLYDVIERLKEQRKEIEREAALTAGKQTQDK